jgi:hypothetical protein
MYRGEDTMGVKLVQNTSSVQRVLEAKCQHHPER